MNRDLVSLAVWVVIIGGAFAYLWRKGMLTKIADYVAETREELKKCSWPSWIELKGTTVVVLVSALALAFLTVGEDFVILKFIRGLFKL